ncbi:MAG TPA: hypothetical protein VFV38_50670 [Ktedonobacteraceae bacterium]|nr:hypothetical protein [Ktedonobacteraceae bacterium]
MMCHPGIFMPFAVKRAVRRGKERESGTPERACSVHLQAMSGELLAHLLKTW